MDVEACLHELGVSPGAGPVEIERAYKARSRALKAQILGALTADLKERRRWELRRLVRCREVALGRRPPESWEAERPPISARRLLRRLADVTVLKLHRASARAFLGVAAGASARDVQESYRRHSRALVRAFAQASADRELAEIRDARAKLRTIAMIALVRPTVSSGGRV